jgi:hypothetical protein
MNRPWFPLSLLFVAAGCGNLDDELEIRQAEAQLVLPEGADPISAYDRYYSVSGRSAKGIFIRSETGKGKMVIVASDKNRPFVWDGGCGVIEAQLDLEKRKWQRPFCHGM